MADESNNSPSSNGPSPDSTEEALRAARASAEEIAKVAAEGAKLNLPDFTGGTDTPGTRSIDLLSDVNLNVKIELGRTRMLVEDVLSLGEGAVVELDKLAGDPVDVYVNDRHVARGEVLVLNDNFCVRINEIISPTDQPAANISGL
ncbi:MAG: hypothetical protein HBSAPP03_00510 [Phycisphaerae bacterium]|nr:MAG: hypothetical protein HBSAPP03_00510 [Phycisphaerae bacterium]